MADNNGIMWLRPCSSTGQSNGLLNRRLQVRVLPRVHGVVAQWLERRSYKAVVVSSILTNPTGKRRKGVDKEERSCIMSLTV